LAFGNKPLIYSFSWLWRAFLPFDVFLLDALHHVLAVKN